MGTMVLMDITWGIFHWIGGSVIPQSSATVELFWNDST